MIRTQRLSFENFSSLGINHSYKDFNKLVVVIGKQKKIIKTLFFKGNQMKNKFIETNFDSKNKNKIRKNLLILDIMSKTIRIKIIIKLWMIFNIFLMRGKCLNFSIFQLFVDNCFLEFLKTIIDLKLLCFENIFVISPFIYF